jgi:hypothetical protein
MEVHLRVQTTKHTDDTEKDSVLSVCSVVKVPLGLFKPACTRIRGFVYNVAMQPLHFIDQPIEVIFDRPPALEKKPGCPNGFIWEGQTYRIIEQITEWHDYQRRGRMASNMRPVHAEAAAQHGSWGVGRDYFRVRVEGGQIFDLYYDRAPRPAAHRGSSGASDMGKDSKQRKGTWVLVGEMSEA